MLISFYFFAEYSQAFTYPVNVSTWTVFNLENNYKIIGSIYFCSILMDLLLFQPVYNENSEVVSII